MTTGLWVLAAQADQTTVEERAGLGETISTLLPSETSWNLLSTCHRVELYGFGAVPELPMRLLRDADAVTHLLRVAAGLESAVVGEDEVLHQVRQAMEAGLRDGRGDRRMNRLFQAAVATGRRARSNRMVGNYNLADLALGWLDSRARLRGRSLVIGGSGHMGSVLAHAAARLGASITVASRDRNRAGRLAAVHGGQGVDLEEGASLATGSAAVAVALAGPWTALERSTGELPPIADLSAPSAVPGSVRAGLNGSFLGIDELFSVDAPVPRGYVEAAEEVVARKSKEYLDWLRSRPA